MGGPCEDRRMPDNEAPNWLELVDDDAFWKVMDLAAKDMDAYRAALASMSRRALVVFGWTVEAMLSRLMEVRASDFPPSILASEDATDDYARGLVCAGRATFEGALEDAALPAKALPNQASWEPSNVHDDRFGEPLPPAGYDLPEA
jgi:hypothetical protein